MRELRPGTFVDTVLTSLSATGWAAILPFVVAVSALLAIGLHDALRGTRGRPFSTVFGAAAPAVAWLLALEASHGLYRDHTRSGPLLAYALAAALLGVTIVAARAGRGASMGAADDTRL